MNEADRTYWVGHKGGEGRAWQAVCRKPGYWTIVDTDGTALHELPMGEFIEFEEPDDDDDDDDDDEEDEPDDKREAVDEAAHFQQIHRETAWSRFRVWWRSRWD